MCRRRLTRQHSWKSQTRNSSCFARRATETSDENPFRYTVLMDEQTRAAYDKAWMQARAGVRDSRITESMTPAQAVIVTLAGLVAGAPVIIPLTLAHFCVEPFASAIKSMSTSCAM
mmetsp:Transcript_17999/g.36365  ORF Transcript_17999/g.36365 Transcript_17999/m.36365 type:complete len:116 (-) Transcript_17999:1025-1372(-)